MGGKPSFSSVIFQIIDEVMAKIFASTIGMKTFDLKTKLSPDPRSKGPIGSEGVTFGAHKVNGSPAAPIVGETDIVKATAQGLFSCRPPKIAMDLITEGFLTTTNAFILDGFAACLRENTSVALETIIKVGDLDTSDKPSPKQIFQCRHIDMAHPGMQLSHRGPRSDSKAKTRHSRDMVSTIHSP